MYSAGKLCISVPTICFIKKTVHKFPASTHHVKKCELSTVQFSYTQNAPSLSYTLSTAQENISVQLPVTTRRIQCEVLTTLPFCCSWIKKFLGQQSKI